MEQKGRKIGWISGAALVVANMVGTGVFTSLGLQLEWVQEPLTVLLLWIIGGLFALSGAFCYAELGTHFPKSGGEYLYLSRIFHPAVGYLSGWISLTVGFSAPIALAGMAMGAYLENYLFWSDWQIAMSVIIIIALVHSISIRSSSRFQNIATVLKLVLILLLIVVGMSGPSEIPLMSSSEWVLEEIRSAAFPVALIFALYAYSGWNAAAYITEEIRDPARNLPRALIGGTLLVALFYVLLQWAMLRQAPLEALRGEIEVGQIAADFLFGQQGAQIVSLLIAILLISSLSAMTWTGPRVIRAMAEDYPFWQFFARDNTQGVPVRATWLQAGLALVFVATGSFEQVLIYSGFVLQVSTFLTVSSLFLLRSRTNQLASLNGVYRSPFFPFLPLFFLVLNTWIIVFIVIDKPTESLLGLLNVLAGLVSYFIARYLR